MDINDLNKQCPFGHRSTNYLSKLGEAPNLQDAHSANTLIKRILHEFVSFLEQTDTTWSPASPEIYDRWGAKSVVISSTVPRRLSDIFPISFTRSFEDVLDRIASFDIRVMRIIMQSHSEFYGQTGSHAESARQVMTLLKDRLEVFRESISSKNPIEEGIPISDEMWQCAVAYQDLQEKASSRSEIGAVNQFILSRPDFIPSMLGIQLQLCDMAKLFFQRNPHLQSGSIAFSEVLLWNNETGETTPSTRLLKLLIHNWGRYFLEKPTLSLGPLMRHAVLRALENEIYHQNIFIFRRSGSQVHLYGVTPKVCPARQVVGQMVLHYFPE